MIKKKGASILITGLFAILIILSFVAFPDSNTNFNEYETNLHLSTIEGFENIEVTRIIRDTNISGYGLVNIEDEISITNRDSNPITSMYYGIPIEDSNNLIYLLTSGKTGNAISFERNYMVYEDYEMIIIHFDTPLLPQQEKTIRVKQSYKNQLSYSIAGNQQYINFTDFVFPLLPYRAEGEIKA